MDKNSSEMTETWLIDLDGVIWRGDSLIAGSDEAVGALCAANKKIVFFTNNSFPTASSLTAKLQSMGIPASAENILTSSMAASRLLNEKSNVLCLGGPGLYEALVKSGHRPVFASTILSNAISNTEYASYLAYYAQSLFPQTVSAVDDDKSLVELTRMGVEFFTILDEIADAERFDACVVGIDPFSNFATLALGFRAISKGARLIATNDDSTYPMKSGLLPGGGTVFKILQTLTGSKGEVAGKPYEVAVELVRDTCDKVAYVVGDRLDTDGLLAKQLGAKFLLVYSGVTSPHGKSDTVLPFVEEENLKKVVYAILGI